MTREQFKKLLQKEIEHWGQNYNSSDPVLKEQAIARAKECEWLLSQFDRKLELWEV